MWWMKTQWPQCLSDVQQPPSLLTSVIQSTATTPLLSCLTPQAPLTPPQWIFFLKVISGFTCYEDTLIKSNKGSDSKFLTADSFQVPLYFLPQAQVLPPLVPARSTNHVSTSCSRNTHSSPSLIGHITSNQSPFPAFSSYFWTSLRIHSALPRKCVIQIINPS